MHDYDVALKLLLQTSAHVTLRKLVGTDIVRWLDVELPKVQTRRADLLAETVEGDIVQLELQSTNDASMALRMGEYSFGVLRLFGRFPRQISCTSASRRFGCKPNCGVRTNGFAFARSTFAS
jgi:hypothetical protein